MYKNIYTNDWYQIDPVRYEYGINCSEFNVKKATNVMLYFESIKNGSTLNIVCKRLDDPNMIILQNEKPINVKVILEERKFEKTNTNDNLYLDKEIKTAFDKMYNEYSRTMTSSDISKIGIFISYLKKEILR